MRFTGLGPSSVRSFLFPGVRLRWGSGFSRRGHLGSWGLGFRVEGFWIDWLRALRFRTLITKALAIADVPV